MNRPEAQDQPRDAAWLTAALRGQADEHEADLTRIEARFERLIVDAPRRAKSRGLQRPARLRLIGIPLGALAAVATATIAVGVTLGITERTTPPVSQAAAPPSLTHTAASRQPSAAATLHPAGTTSARNESSPSPSPSPGPLTATGAVDSHSTQYWAQENLSVTTTRATRALQVIVTVSGGSTVQSTGSWSTILSADLYSTAAPTVSGLTYTFTLKPGQVLQPGTYAFGFQFGRPSTGHSFALDTYSVTATTTDNGAKFSATGAFSE